MQQQQVIDNAIEGLRQATDLPVEWLPNAPASFDGYVTIHGGTRLIKLATEVKRRAMAHQLSELKQLQKAEGETLLLAESISDEFKHALRESKQNYLDGAGNCFIHSSGMLLVIQGRKAPANQTALKHPFGKSGLRVLFTLLTQPGAINLGIRELADQTGVSVGTAQQTLDYLKKSGYVVRVDTKQKKLVQLDKLRELWVGRYATTLKTSLLVGRFRLPKNLSPADWQHVALQPGTFWGGEAAADALTNNLRPGTLTLYTTEDRAGLLQKYKLLPDPNGPVEVNRLFWKASGMTTTDIPTVPSLLIYADLLAIADPRTTEIARQLYQEHVEDNI
jgi:hypothetical protein